MYEIILNCSLHFEPIDFIKIQGFIIAFTSDFIPRLVYRIHYSPDGSLSGYTNFRLSAFATSDLKDRHEVDEGSPEVCYYNDFRKPPDSPDGDAYGYREAYWHVLAAKLAFVVAYQNIVSLTVMMIK